MHVLYVALYIIIPWHANFSYSVDISNYRLFKKTYTFYATMNKGKSLARHSGWANNMVSGVRDLVTSNHDV